MSEYLMREALPGQGKVLGTSAILGSGWPRLTR